MTNDLTANDLRLIGLYALDGATGQRHADGTITVRHANGDVLTYERAFSVNRRWTLATN